MLNPIFFVVRHGLTPGNSTNTYRGWSNDANARLTGSGRDVVREAALWLKSAGQSFPLVMSDDLDRSVESREILKSLLQIPVAQTDKRLRPLNVGDFTGKSKLEYPLEKYLKNKSLVIPGGESVNSFNRREAEFFDVVTNLVGKIGKPILIVGHGSTVSFLHNHFNNTNPGNVGYEGLCNPGGVLMFTAKGIEPLTQKRSESPSSMAQGTAVAGFVTDELNRPPRECWNCKWFQRDINDLSGCANPVVRIDPQLVDRRQSDGTVAVGEQDCCNYFVNRVGT